MNTSYSVKDFRSENAGRSFGRLYKTGTPSLTPVQLEKMARTLQPSPAFTREYYLLGFVEGYCFDSSGTIVPQFIPLREQMKKEAEEEMGKFSQAKARANQSTPQSTFLNKLSLASMNVEFTVTQIEKTVGQYGEQYILHIELPLDVLGHLGIDSSDDTKISFSATSASRNRLLDALMPECPIERCFVDEIPLENGYRFISLECHDEDDDSRMDAFGDITQGKRFVDSDYTEERVVDEAIAKATAAKAARPATRPAARPAARRTS